jgi:hypothetical protein
MLVCFCVGRSRRNEVSVYIPLATKDDRGKVFAIESEFNVAISFSHGLKILKEHGLRSFYQVLFIPSFIFSYFLPQFLLRFEARSCGVSYSDGSNEENAQKKTTRFASVSFCL